MIPAVTYQRPVTATLMVRLSNGEEFDATPQDVARFGYVDRSDAYQRFSDTLAGILLGAGLIGRAKDLTQAYLNPLRHLAEVAICYACRGQEDLLNHPDMAGTYEDIAAIERVLRDAAESPAEG